MENSAMSPGEVLKTTLSGSVKYPSNLNFEDSDTCKDSEKIDCYVMKIGKDKKNYIEILYKFYYSGIGDVGTEIPVGSPKIKGEYGQEFTRLYNSSKDTYEYYEIWDSSNLGGYSLAPSNSLAHNNTVVLKVEAHVEQGNESLLKDFDKIFASIETK